MRRSLIPVAVALFAAIPALAQNPGPGAIDTLLLRAHAYYLSSDLLEGRGTGARGADVAALYLASAAEQLGLSGLGQNGSFFQPVPIVEAEIDTTGTSLTVTDSVGSVTFRSPAYFIPNAGSLPTLVGFEGELVWVGTAGDVRSHPDKLPPLSGRIALMAGVFGADGAAAEMLRARGATGVIQFVGDNDVYQLYVRSRGESRMSVDDSATHSSFFPNIPSVIARADLVRRLLPANVREEQLDQPFAIPGKRVQVRVRVQPHAVSARNVIAVLSGTDRAKRDEYVVYTAHYDHLGIGEPDAHGDSIYNGFSDNAAGCAMLLAIAKYFTAHRPARSVAFLFFTGEERGLLGSDFFAAHPLIAPERIAGVINLDAGAPPAPSVQWRVSGGDRSELGRMAIDVARDAGWDATAAQASPNTDYFPFLRLGVPAVFLVPGPGAYEGLTTDSSQALRRRWDHYHQADDEWHSDFPYAGVVRYADYALRLGLRLLSAPMLPRAVAFTN